MKIPEDLSSLKRPALQALCKKVGIKANGKNAEMIKALENYRDNLVQPKEECTMSADEEVSMETGPESQDSSTGVPLASDADAPPTVPPSPVASGEEGTKIAKKNDRRKGGKRRKTIQRSKKADTSTSTESETAESAAEESTTQDVQPENSITQANPEEKDSAEKAGPRPDVGSFEPPSRKRKRRDTHSISPNSSLCSAVKVPRLSINTDMAQSVADTTTQSLSPSSPMNPPETELRRGKDSEVLVTPSATVAHTSMVGVSPDQQPEAVECSTNDRPPFSPPSERESVHGSSRKRKRNSTFVVSPSQNEAVEEAEENDEIVSSTSGKVEAASDVMAELQNLLDERAKEIMSAPGYEPVYKDSATLASRLPVKSTVQKKFDKAHAKQFGKMKSIEQLQKEKNRKRSQLIGPSSAKKPRLETQSSKVPRPSSLKQPQKKCMAKTSCSSSTVVKSEACKSEVFKPTVTTVKTANLRFSELPNSTTKSAIKSVTGVQGKTPKKATAVVAGKTPSKSMRPVYNLQESLKKKPNYKPYTGPVPKLGKVQH